MLTRISVLKTTAKAARGLLALHGARLQETGVEGERLRQVVRSCQGLALVGSLHVLLQQWLVLRVGDRDHLLHAVTRSQSTQVLSLIHI